MNARTARPITERGARALKDWEEYREAQRWRESNPPCWRPVLSEQEQREFDEYSDRHNLPF